MYSEYAHVLEQVIGATVDRLPLSRANRYEVDLDRLHNSLQDGYDLVVLVNPNSPTGRHIPRQALETILRSVPSRTRVWVDETYIEYAGVGESLERFAAQSDNVIVCKSMSKVYALSGMRVGYLCAGAHQLEALRSITPPWVVGLPAQLAASLALGDPDYYAARYGETRELREQLRAQLGPVEWETITGVGNFLLAHLPENGPSARDLIQDCERRGLFLRNAGLMGSQMGPRAVRVAVKDAATNARMVNIIHAAQTTGAEPNTGPNRPGKRSLGDGAMTRSVDGSGSRNPYSATHEGNSTSSPMLPRTLAAPSPKRRSWG
jgi:histidinol-phosphate/aromatic aminotransferase/cobyric acid decarboxylase-like protein